MTPSDDTAGFAELRPEETAPGLASPLRFSVVICTRNRPEQLARTLAALDSQTRRGFAIFVVDQSDQPDLALARRSEDDPALTLIRDAGRGLSRARNLGWRRVDSEWVAFLDDDCIPAPDWAEHLERTLAGHPEVDCVSGDISAPGSEEDRNFVPVAALRVHEERTVSGRWTLPARVGFGVCALRTSTVERLGGWDERLGAGTDDFPAAEDMDFNYRLLRAGGVAYWNPAIRVVHEQWRDDAAVVRLYRGRAAAWAGFAVKHFKTGDLAGGTWLWWRGFLDCARMLASAGRRRHSMRIHLGLAMFRGLAGGTVRALRRSW